MASEDFTVFRGFVPFPANQVAGLVDPVVVQLAPDLVPALNELGYVYENDKQYQQALRIYEKAYAAGGSTDASLKQSIDRVRALASER